MVGSGLASTGMKFLLNIELKDEHIIKRMDVQLIINDMLQRYFGVGNRCVWVIDQMRDIIDFNTGTIIDGISSIEDCGEKLLDYILEVASGRKQVSARKLGQDDFIPWKRAMSL